MFWKLFFFVRIWRIWILETRKVIVKEEENFFRKQMVSVKNLTQNSVSKLCFADIYNVEGKSST